MPDDVLVPGAIADPVVLRSPAEHQHLGEFMALVSFRPADGGAVQRVAGFAETEMYARAEALEAAHAALGMVQTMSPDSPRVRRFIEAASHMHDLRQARKALESAEASEESNVATQLRTFAVIAYCRTYDSRARADLRTIIDLSEEHRDLSERLKTIRNRYGAHSENSMTVTIPVLDLQRQLDGSISIEQVSAFTIETPMPAGFVTEFESMLDHLIEQLTDALPPLQEAVRAELSVRDVNEVFANPRPVQFVRATMEEWEPSSRRPRYPSSHLSPVHIAAGGSTTFNVTITR